MRKKKSIIYRCNYGSVTTFIYNKEKSTSAKNNITQIDNTNITVTSYDGNILYFNSNDYDTPQCIINFIKKTNPNMLYDLHIINDTTVLNNNFKFSKNEKYTLNIIKTANIQWYEQEFKKIQDSGILCIDAETQSEIGTEVDSFSCIHIRYNAAADILELIFIGENYIKETKMGCNTSIKFYYKTGYTKLTYDNDIRFPHSQILINKFNEFSQTFINEHLMFLDNLLYIFQNSNIHVIGDLFCWYP